VNPRFRAQAEGSSVFYSNSIKLESAKLDGMFLHTSPKVYSTIPNPNDLELPTVIRKDQVCEVNCSAQFTTFIVQRFAHFETAQLSKLKMGGGFRLYHSQAESFLHASCNPDKEHGGTVMRQRTTKQGHEPIPFKHGHIPYLKPISGEDPDPSNPLNQSSKGVWCFENLKRSQGSVVKWGSPVRIRHMPSGKYLAVNTEDPAYEQVNEDGASWFAAFMVDDAADIEEELSETTRYCAESQMIFYVVSSEPSDTEAMPSTECAIRIEHRFQHIDENGRSENMSIFLHNTEVAKAVRVDDNGVPLQRDNVICRSLKVCFSSLKSAQDFIKVMPVSQCELSILQKVKALIPPCKLYTAGLTDRERPISQDEILSDMHVLLQVIALQYRGEPEWHKETGIDWLAKANSMLPAAFSQLFDGEEDHLTQRISRDMKLMDAVFEMGLAAYNRCSPQLPFEGWEAGSPLDGPRGMQKLIHVALQMMFKNNTGSQNYFSRRSSVLMNDYNLAGSNFTLHDKVNWMTIIMQQLDDALGAAVTLSNVLSTNEDLLRKFVSPELIGDFTRMIRELGPQERLINFLESISDVEGRPIKSNQEMILRLVWMNDDARQNTTLNVFERRGDKLPSFGSVKLPSGEYTTITRPNSFKDFPQAYLGKEVYESIEGFAPIYVSWKGRWV